MRRLPPQQIEKNLSDLIDLVSESISSYETILCHKIVSFDEANSFYETILSCEALLFHLLIFHVVGMCKSPSFVSPGSQGDRLNEPTCRDN